MDEADRKANREVTAFVCFIIISFQVFSREEDGRFLEQTLEMKFEEPRTPADHQIIPVVSSHPALLAVL